MSANMLRGRRVVATGGICTLLLTAAVFVTAACRDSQAGVFHRLGRWLSACDGPNRMEEGLPSGEVEGTMYWLRSPEQERRVAASLYNRLCLRCHGVDGRGVWDIPDVPDFTNVCWQTSRSDAQLVRLTLQGRGAVMPAYVGILNLEEAWALARYIRTFVPGTETPRPDHGQPQRPSGPATLPAPKRLEDAPK